MRGDDRHTVPLCRACHTDGQGAVHKSGSKHELKWFAGHGIDAVALAKQLWQDGGPYVETVKARKGTRMQRPNGWVKQAKIKPKGTRHNWPSQPMQSRGFSKVSKRKFNGEVVAK